MSGDEPFLARWSRRKREGDRADEPPAEQPPAVHPAAAPVPVPDSAEAGSVVSDQTGEAAFDPSTLPALDSIDAATDIRGFLARGVPAAVGREALRRAWLADPAVRDFIGPAENAWDFTAPDGVPGFGPLLPPAPAAPSDLIRQAIRSDAAPTESARQAPGPADSQAPNPQAEDDSHRNLKAGCNPDAQAIGAAEISTGRIVDMQTQDVAPPKANNDAELSAVLPSRRHGGALPG